MRETLDGYEGGIASAWNRRVPTLYPELVRLILGHLDNLASILPYNDKYTEIYSTLHSVCLVLRE